MGYLELDDGRLFYEVAGSGPPLIFLHAGVADSRMWQPQVEHLSASFRTIRYDLRGFGRSPLPDGPFSHGDDLIALAAGLALGPAWLVAASFGASVALDACLAHPALVRGLVLAAPTVGGFEPSEEILRFGAAEEELLEAGLLEEATELNLRMWVDGPQRGPDEVEPALRALVGEMQLHAFSIPLPDNVSLREFDPPAIGRLGQVRAPLLVVAGALDVPAFLALGERLAQEVPGAERVVIPGAAHMVSMEAPARFNALVDAFVAAHTRGG